ncbi:hypothetical protein KCU64_g14575, partial [Aureobasidium melanogenum]
MPTSCPLLGKPRGSLAFVRYDPNFVDNTTTTPTSSSSSSSPIIQEDYHYLMLAPYANVGAFMKEWRSRSPPTYRGFGNQSSPAIPSNNQSSAVVAFNRNPQSELLEGLVGSSGGGYGGSGDVGDAGKIYGIVFGIFGGIVLLSGIIGTWLLIQYHRKTRRQASEETLRDVSVEQVSASQSSVESSSLLPSSSSSSNASSQHPETQARGTNPPSAIDGPASRRTSLQPYGPVDNGVDGMILPNTSDGFSSVRIEETTLLTPYENDYRDPIHYYL